jgi:ABC-type enterochelin transport system substrate-binding protein
MPLNVKAGDTVIVSGRWRKSIETVEKITPTGLIKVGSSLYHPDGTERAGDKWDRNQLLEATPERIQEVRNNELVQLALHEMRQPRTLTVDQARQILEILKREPKEAR